MSRKHPLITDQYHHVFTRSIAKYVIFKSPTDYERMLATCQFYRIADPKEKFSQPNTLSLLREPPSEQRYLVNIIAFCLMPTHIHLILQQRIDHGITDFMRRTLNSYSHYFNLKYDRRGPLWEGRFKNKPIGDDAYMLTATLYIHANPIKAGLVKNARAWPYSSYLEYLGAPSGQCSITQHKEHIQILPEEYEHRLFEDLTAVSGQEEEGNEFFAPFRDRNDRGMEEDLLTR